MIQSSLIMKELSEILISLTSLYAGAHKVGIDLLFCVDLLFSITKHIPKIWGDICG
jgi:hypothetical protein